MEDDFHTQQSLDHSIVRMAIHPLNYDHFSFSNKIKQIVLSGTMYCWLQHYSTAAGGESWAGVKPCPRTTETLLHPNSLWLNKQKLAKSTKHHHQMPPECWDSCLLVFWLFSGFLFLLKISLKTWRRFQLFPPISAAADRYLWGANKKRQPLKVNYFWNIRKPHCEI